MLCLGFGSCNLYDLRIGQERVRILDLMDRVRKWRLFASCAKGMSVKRFEVWSPLLRRVQVK